LKAAFWALCSFSILLAARLAAAESPAVFAPYPDTAEPIPATPSLAAAIEGHYVQPAAYDENYVQISCDDNAGGCDCCPCDCDCNPLWTVRAGAVILHRSRPDDDVIAESATGLLQVSAGGDFTFGWDGGVDIYVARDFGCGYGLEARYFNVDSRAGFDRDISIDLNFGGGTIVDLLNTQATYDSNLDSAEINARFDSSPRVTWLAGFRYLDLDELLDYDITVLGFLHNDIRWRTTNHLYGGQMGADLNLWNLNSPLKINSILKAGIYGNDADNSFRFTRPVLSTINGNSDASDVSFVGEIDVNFAYQMTQHFALTGGYQLMWIDNVALASDQAALALDQGDINIITTSGDLFYHGALAGAEFSW
jgi:Putative beta barrel porin-7 (BBP7)